MDDLLDKVAVRLYGRTWAEAQEAGECIACGRPVKPIDLSPNDRAEYDMSALCPQCYDDLADEEDES
jgi:hypothetical protein